MQENAIERSVVVRLGQRNSQSTSLGGENTGFRRKTSKENALYDEIDALKQDGRTLIDYVKRAQDILERAPAQWERYIIESFVEGIADEEQRELVANTMNEEGYTWKRAIAAVRAIEDHPRGRGRRGDSYSRMKWKRNPNVTP